jgi:hypothetical protein
MMKMEAESCFEMLVPVYKTTWFYNPEHNYAHCCVLSSMLSDLQHYLHIFTTHFPEINFNGSFLPHSLQHTEFAS